MANSSKTLDTFCCCCLIESYVRCVLLLFEGIYILMMVPFHVDQFVILLFLISSNFFLFSNVKKLSSISISGQNIRTLVSDGFIVRKPSQINSRARARTLNEAKRKGRHSGYGNDISSLNFFFLLPYMLYNFRSFLGFHFSGKRGYKRGEATDQDSLDE